MCLPAEGVRSVGDMGVHIFRRDWLLGRLHACLSEDPSAPREVWGDVYDISDIKGRVYLYVPDNDLKHIDMGTPAAYRRVVETLNSSRKDRSGNIVFPGAQIHPESIDCIALPGSFAAEALSKVIIPENSRVQSTGDYLIA